MTTGQTASGVEELQGEVERLVYSADETGFTICRLRVPGKHELVTVAGSLPGIQPGERLSLEGRWLDHPKYGLQFRITRYTSQVPATANGIKRYLSSNLVKGIGPVMAGRLVDMFGDETLEVIEESPERLAEVPGIGPKRVQGIKSAWDEQREVREVMLFAGPRSQLGIRHSHLQDLRPRVRRHSKSKSVPIGPGH